MSASRSRFVVAETLAQAKDAAELIDIDYEALPSVTDTAEAAEGKIAVWDECPDNISNLFEAGNKAATDAAFASAAHIVKRRYVISRVYAHFMEPRGAIGVWDPGEDRFTLYADVQYPHRVRQALATRIFKIPESKIRVIAGDVGGGFGTKGWQYPEHRLVLLAAKKLRRPVKWTCERSEAIQADEHARDNVSDAELALDKDGKFLGLRVKTLRQCRRLHLVRAQPARDLRQCRHLDRHLRHPGRLCRGLRGDGQHQRHRALSRRRPARGDLCHRAPDRRRGARTGLRPGRVAPQEPDPAVEAAVQDRARPQLRLRRLPRQPAEGAGAGRLGRLRRRAATRRKARGKLRGIGIANPIEKAAGPGQEFAEIRFHPSGNATLLMGSKNQGQGHETTFKQVLNEKLGLDPATVQYIDGDTDRVAFGIGTNGSRSTVIGGSALWMAADKVIAKGKRIAAHLLEAADADIEFAVSDDGGNFAVAGTDRRIGITDVAKASFQAGRLPPGLEGGLYETGTFAPDDNTYPNGCHVCEVEIDPDTGALEIVRYVVDRRCRHGGEPDRPQGPDPWRRRAGARPGADGAGRLRPRVGAEPDRQLHGLRDAARRHDAATWRSPRTRCRPSATRSAPRARARPARSARCRRSSTP